MRFCLVSTQETVGGGEVLIASIADELARAGHTIGWLARANSPVLQSLERDGRDILYRFQDRGRNLHDFRAVRRVMRHWSPDIVVMNDTHAVVLAGLAAAGMRNVRPVRLAYKHTVFPLRSRLKYRFLTDKVVCVSQAAQQTLVAGGMGGDEAVVVYGGTTPPAAEQDASARIRDELGVDEDCWLLVAVGSLLDCKGHSDLLRAVSKLKRGERPVQLVIAGEGQEREHLQSLITELELQDNVRLLGFRSDANRLLQAADLIIHPSHAEGLSLVLIQAQMLRKPIVATAVGGAAEVLDVDKESQYARWIAQPKDADNLASQIESALRTIGDRALTNVLYQQLEKIACRAKDRFSLERNSGRLADIAASLL